MADPKDFSQLIQDAEHIVLIGLLIEHAKAHDQNFSTKARDRLDYVLGKYFITEGSPTEIIAAIRAKVLAQLNDPSTLTSHKEATRITLRRRFLNWLQSE
jgi:hypothetical protein